MCFYVSWLTGRKLQEFLTDTLTDTFTTFTSWTNVRLTGGGFRRTVQTLVRRIFFFLSSAAHDLHQYSSPDLV